jgi:hypothetical protein
MVMKKISGLNAVPTLISFIDSAIQVPLSHRTNVEIYTLFTQCTVGPIKSVFLQITVDTYKRNAQGNLNAYNVTNHVVTDTMNI